MIGLEHLTNLKDLSLAGNMIEIVNDTAIDNFIHLETLNLSGNQIGSFIEITKLGRLPKLRTISLSDPHFGSCPVCYLSNYTTFIWSQIRNANEIDGSILNNELKIQAEATFIKKRMYYSMRIHTLKRNTTNLIRSAEQLTRKRCQCIRNAMKVLSVIKREVESNGIEWEIVNNMNSNVLMNQQQQSVQQQSISNSNSGINSINDKKNDEVIWTQKEIVERIRYLILNEKQ
ncbi:MAG: putative leucine rich repeat protein, partial [Streblomastix strix]